MEICVLNTEATLTLGSGIVRGQNHTFYFNNRSHRDKLRSDGDLDSLRYISSFLEFASDRITTSSATRALGHKMCLTTVAWFRVLIRRSTIKRIPDNIPVLYANE